MNADPQFLGVPRNWSVTFLPYLEDAIGNPAEAVIGYPNPNKGYGYGSWIEYYAQEEAARARFASLQASGCVEWLELRQAHESFRLLGKLVSDWKDETSDRVK